MSGIVGIWNLDGRPVDNDLLTKVTATMAHRGPDGKGMWVRGPVGLACQLFRVTPEASTETQPLVNSSGTALVFDGRLDNREELLSSLKGSPGISADSPDPAVVMAAYDAFGDRFPVQLNGSFALALYEPRRNQLLLARDAVGVRPIYYCRIGNTFMFASEIKALLAHPRMSTRPNDDVLAELLLGNPVRDDQGLTFFEDVFTLLPAHVALLTPQGFVTQRYWDFDASRRLRFGSFQEYAEAFRFHFEQAVSRLLRSAYPVAVAVSGGLDSSSIFCLAEVLHRRSPERHPPVLGLSYTCTDGSPSDENAFLLEIEQDYGVGIERTAFGPLGFLNNCRKSVWQAEAPILDGMWNNSHAFLHNVRQRGARVLLAGHWGDQMLFEQAYLIDVLHQLEWGKLRTHLREFARWSTDVDPKWFRRRFFQDLVRYHVPDVLVPSLRKLRSKLVRPLEDRPWFSEAFRNLARQNLFRHTRIRGPFTTAYARSLYQTARSRFHVLAMECNNKVASMHGLEMDYPYLDRELLSFLMAIPGEMQTWKGVPKAILREGMRGVLPDAIVNRRWKADFTHLENGGMEKDYYQLVDMLHSDRMAVRFGYVDENVMRKKLAQLNGQFRNPTCDITWRLLDLLGLELWLQTFFGDN
ncbi:MAG: asparagine synthase-related protein [Bacteroidota bacterium]